MYNLPPCGQGATECLLLVKDDYVQYWTRPHISRWESVRRFHLQSPPEQSVTFVQHVRTNTVTALR
jgi:hypothetical protein